MKTQASQPRWKSGHRPALGVAIMMALGLASVAGYADQSAATAAASRVADVSLADLNLSTSEGMSAARERLHTMAAPRLQPIMATPIPGGAQARCGARRDRLLLEA